MHVKDLTHWNGDWTPIEIQNKTSFNSYTITSVAFAFSIFLFAAIGIGLIAKYENPVHPDNVEIGEQQKEKQESRSTSLPKKNKNYEIAALVCFGISIVSIPICMFAITKMFRSKEELLHIQKFKN